MKKLTLFLALSMSAQAFGQAARFDGVAQSTRLVNGITLTIPLPSATITVYNFGTTTKASVCPDITATSCTSTVPNNPVTSDAQGNFGFWIAGGVYDYTVTPSSGTVQGPYHAVVPFGATSNGSITYSKSFENIRYADQFAGANFSAKVNACIADVISHGGGVCDAIALDGAQTISSEIDVGNSSSVPVLLRLPPHLSASVTITDGTSCGIKVFDRSSLIGPGSGGTNSTQILAADNANIDSVICTDPSPGGGGSYIRIEGIEPGVSNTFAGTLVNGVANIQALFDDSVISRVFVRGYGVRGWYIHNVCCGTSFYNIGANGFGITGAEPLVVGKNGESTLAGFYGISPVHPGDTKNNILIQAAGAGKTTHLSFYDTYLEPNSTDTTTPLISVNAVAGGINFYGLQQGGTPAGGTTAYIVDIVAGTRAVTIDGLQTGSLTNFINDHVNIRTVTGSTGNVVPRYSFGSVTAYDKTLTTDSLTIGAGTANTATTGSGSTLVKSTSPTFTSSAIINDAAATNRSLFFNTASVARWIARANTTAEGGANAGSDFELVARDDSGNFLSTTILCTRSTGNCTFSGLGTFTGGVKAAGAISPTVAGAQTAGTNALPFSSVYVGAAANNNSQLTGTFTAARVQTLPDITGNVSVYLSGSDAAVDLASVATAACTTERTVAVTGAAFGDAVDVMAGTALEAGGFLTGKVTSSGNIKWQLCNLSGGAIDRASDTYSIRVRK